MPTLTVAEFTAQDEAAIRRMFDVSPGYIKAGDFASWAALYADDGVLQPPNAPRIKGRSNLQAWGEAFPQVLDLAFFDVQIRGEGHLAYGTSGYRLEVKDAAPETGKQLVVFRRATDGSWKIVAASFNSDLPGFGVTPRA
jgi:ketosteroid isomerase-like protein